jgi:nickel-dependent lactate racemase
MLFEFRYGDRKIDLNIPDENLIGVVEPQDVQTLEEASSYVNMQLDLADLDGFLEESSRLLIVVNDGYRATPSHIVLSALRDRLSNIDDVRLIVATGLHRKPTEKELSVILGPDFTIPDSSIYCSDAYDDSLFEVVGTRADGSEVRLHKLLNWADRILTVGSVEPHYFAGFTGGPKSFLPGLAHYQTIASNHNKAVSVDCRPCKIDGNPVSDSMKEAATLLDRSKIFAVQFVIDARAKVVDVFVGDLWDAYAKAVNRSRSTYMVAIQSRATVVISVNAPPLDRNLYQLQKSFENVKSVVADGGTIVVVSGCEEGVGNEEFYKLAGNYASADDLLADQPSREKVGFHKLYRTALHRKTIDILVKTELDDATVRRVFLEPIDDIQKFIDEEVRIEKENCRVLVVMDAGHVVPYVDEAA